MDSFGSSVSASELFQRGWGISYIDFTILNSEYSDVAKDEISLDMLLGKDIILNTPIIASPMDTVTSAELCIAIAQEGGIGAIHYNHKKNDGQTPDVDEQIREIEKVKRFQSGFIETPITASPEENIETVIERGKSFSTGKSTINNFPVTEDGSSNGKLVGFLRREDYLPGSHDHMKVKERMFPIEKFLDETIITDDKITLDDAKNTVVEKRLLYLTVINQNGNLRYLVTRSDLEKYNQFPLATLDSKERLRVLFAVDTRMDNSAERLERGFAAGADGVIVDTSQGFTKYSEDMLRYISKRYPEKLLIGGNISTAEAANFLQSIGGVDAYRCGQGSGSICTTAGAIGVSRSGASGVYESARYLYENYYGKMIKTIADGGIKEVGDIVKALSIGAHFAMLGKMLAGTDEAPGETDVDFTTGRKIKVYRGMGSAEANVGGIRGYSKLPQGVKGKVEYRGGIHMWVPLIRDGIISGLQALNCRTIEELHSKMYKGDIRYERRTVGSIQEAGVNVNT